MFTVFARLGDSKTRLDAAAVDYQARFLARRWSRMMSFEVMVIEDDQEKPRCVYKEGVELFCACPGTGAAPSPNEAITQSPLKRSLT